LNKAKGGHAGSPFAAQWMGSSSRSITLHSINALNSSRHERRAVSAPNPKTSWPICRRGIETPPKPSSTKPIESGIANGFQNFRAQVSLGHAIVDYGPDTALRHLRSEVTARQTLTYLELRDEYYAQRKKVPEQTLPIAASLHACREFEKSWLALLKNGPMR
jgi:hypothetical protein